MAAGSYTWRQPQVRHWCSLALAMLPLLRQCSSRPIVQKPISECEPSHTNFTADSEVETELRHYAPRKWHGKLDYLLSTLKRRVVDRRIPGAVVELGTFEGQTSHMFRRLIDKFDPGRPFHCYDSFQGLPSRRPEDSKQVRKEDGEGGMRAGRDQFIERFKRERLRLPDGIHEGFFADIAASEYPSPIAFAYFDGDLYSSILDSFKMVFHKMSPGGVIMVHDYTTEGLFPGAKKAIEDFLRDKPERGVLECYSIIGMVVKAENGTFKVTRGA